MPSKRDVLAHLTRDELLATADQFELEVADRRVREQLFEVVASSKRAGLADALAPLSRDRLKEVCRGLELDDVGKEKAVLVERLIGAPAKASPAPAKALPAGPKATPVAAKANGASRAAPPPTEKVDLSPSDHLTIERLEGYLWSAADILRGSIDSSDYKNFIFGLLFLKRLSDRFDEECEALVAGGHDPEDADEHDFFVPKRARWSEIQKVATNLGETLNKACAALEEKNTALEGVLAGIDYNDERRLGDARNRDAVLARLVQQVGPKGRLRRQRSSKERQNCQPGAI
jgi:type I restriction enzyme M protein